MEKKALGQPKRRTIHATSGRRHDMAPMEEPLLKMPEPSARSRSGNHSELPVSRPRASCPLRRFRARNGRRRGTGPSARSRAAGSRPTTRACRARSPTWFPARSMTEPGERVADGVGEQESGDHARVFDVAEVQLRAEHGAGDGERLAVEVVDHGREKRKRDEQPTQPQDFDDSLDLTMKALLLKNYKELELVDVPTPESGARGRAGSREGMRHLRQRCAWITMAAPGRRIPPIVMGHEAAGQVTATGRECERSSSAGDRVTFDSTISCGKCYFCTHGDINLCDNRQVLGVSCGEFRRDGAFAEYVLVPQQHHVQTAGGFARLRACRADRSGFHRSACGGASRRFELGDTAVVVGSGMIGLLALQAVRLAGCSQRDCGGSG